MTTPSYTSTSTRSTPSLGAVFIAPLTGLIDLFIDAEFEATADITEDPVESRATLTDHYQRKPRRIRLTAGTSDVVAGTGQRPVAAYAKIMDMMENATVFSVIHPYGTFRNMVVQSVTHKMDASTGSALVAALTVQEVFFAPVEQPTPENAADRQARLAAEQALQSLERFRPRLEALNAIGRLETGALPLATGLPVTFPGGAELSADTLPYQTALRLASNDLGRVSTREATEAEFNAAILRLEGTGLVQRRDDNLLTAQSR